MSWQILFKESILALKLGLGLRQPDQLTAFKARVGNPGKVCKSKLHFECTFFHQPSHPSYSHMNLQLLEPNFAMTSGYPRQVGWWQTGTFGPNEMIGRVYHSPARATDTSFLYFSFQTTVFIYGFWDIRKISMNKIKKKKCFRNKLPTLTFKYYTSQLKSSIITKIDGN